MKATLTSAIQEEKAVNSSLRELIKDRTHFRNLILLIFLWISASFDYTLINFQLKYIEGDIYTNTIVSSVSEVCAYIISGAIYEKIGTRISFIGFFIIAIIGSVVYIIFGETAKDLVPLMILGAKFGISGSFNVVYLANTMFPPIFASTAFGICNAFGRLASMLAP